MYVLCYMGYYILYSFILYVIYCGPQLIKLSYFTVFIYIYISEWGRVPERDMLSLGVMGMGAGGLRKFFRRRRRRRRRPPPKIGFGWKSMKYVENGKYALSNKLGGHFFWWKKAPAGIPLRAPNV